MKLVVILSLLLSSFSYVSATELKNYESASHRISLLELYTSEGCSSCPPAEHWLAGIQKQGFDRQQIIPLAFHVTYWDYLGWQDRFSSKEYDQRQRKMVIQEGGRTVYTPQFFLNSKTLRNISSLNSHLIPANNQPAGVKIKASVSKNAKGILLNVNLSRLHKKVDDVVRLYMVSYENNIQSAIKSGENAGRNTNHQYVVRQMQTAFMSLKNSKERQFFMKKGKANWTGLIVFVESNGFVEQVLDITL